MARFVKLIGTMILSMISVVFGGVLNMLFVKTPVYRKLKRPIDGGRTWSDGRRLFGENKTFAGLAGMTLGTLVSQVVMGLLLKALGLSHLSDVYRRHENTVKYNALAGGLFGLAYALFELPNSFAKRRFDIRPGKTTAQKGLLGKVFFLVDQVDSMFGVMAVLAMLSPIGIVKYFGYIALGGVIHILTNLGMIKAGIRKNL
ncbi:MAG: CDP-archaeol synthase [Clostridia bacterium]|nr:CDP-archaeol synthase [Clostridia bacterium]